MERSKEQKAQRAADYGDRCSYATTSNSTTRTIMKFNTVAEYQEYLKDKVAKEKKPSPRPKRNTTKVKKKED